MVEVRPTVANFSEAMKEMQSLCYQNRLHTDGNPVMEWMASNLVAHTDAKDNVYPRKETHDNKIDGIVALIMTIKQSSMIDIENNFSEDEDTQLTDLVI